MIFKGSRLVGTNVFIDEDNNIPYLDQPETSLPLDKTDLVYQFKAGDRLDILANRFYKDPQKHWIILQANPEYANETEITEGSILTIPNPERIDLE